MDFIERWLHISPDHGSGAYEVLFLAALALVVVIAVTRYRARKDRSTS
jgi:hypothetical protein